MKNKILLNEAQNSALVQEGYVVVDLMDPQQIYQTFSNIENKIAALKLVNNNHKNIDVTFHCTYLDHDIDYKLLVWKELTSLIEPILNTAFTGHKIIQANLFNKAPGTGFIAPHQNLTTVDEEVYTSVSIWVPLQDTTELNGTLYFLPKSHGKFEKYRNSNIHWAPMDASSEISDYQMLPVRLQLGQALIFDDSIVHGSPINQSKENRYVFHFLAIPLMADPVYCKRTNTTVSLIKVADSFWQTYTPGDPEPMEPIIKTKPFNPRTYTKASLLDEMAD